MEHFQDLATYGPLGLLCALELLAIRTLFTMYVDAQEKRISESRESQKIVQELMIIIREMKNAVRGS